MAPQDSTGQDPGDSPPANVPTGTRIIETYEVGELVSSGGMGEVYRGVNVHTGAPVAIKIVLPSLAEDEKISKLFKKEAQILGRLNHDAIVRYHIYTLDHRIGRPCLVMEFVDGESLARRLDVEGPLPEDEVRRLIRRLAEGLGEAHKAGIVHRDLTPGNVILQGGSVERAKIIDFGIARTADAGGTLQDWFAGTLDFVSPEQLGDFGGTIDARSDIYSLGLLAAACCLGRAIPMGATVDEAVTFRRGVPDISGIPPALAPALAKMLEPNPASRPGSMAEVVALLEAPPDAPAERRPRPKTMPAPDRPEIAPVQATPPGQADTPPRQSPGTAQATARQHRQSQARPVRPPPDTTPPPPRSSSPMFVLMLLALATVLAAAAFFVLR